MRISGVAIFLNPGDKVNINNDAVKSIFQNTGGRGDVVSISNLGKKAFKKMNNPNSDIGRLLKQKQNLTQQKNSLIDRVLEKGESSDLIKDKIKGIDEKISAIDKQIRELMIKKQNKELYQKKEKKNTPAVSDIKPKTKQEIANEKLNDIVSLSTDISQSKVVSSVKNKMQGEAKILEKEIEIDEGRSATGQKASLKREKLNETNDKISNTSEKLEKFMNNVNNKTADIRNKENGSPNKFQDKKTEKKPIRQMPKILEYEQVQKEKNV